MTIYKRDKAGVLRDSDGNAMELPDRDEICTPRIVSDIEPYRSPVDGRVISSRNARRDDLKRNNCVEFEPSLSPTKGKFRNAAFCKKHNLPLSEDYK